MAVEVWTVAKEQSAKELRTKKTEVEQLEGALDQLGKQYEQLQRKVCVFSSFGNFIHPDKFTVRFYILGVKVKNPTIKLLLII
jgi:hypothetical protein